MKLSKISETSIAVSLFKYFYKWYGYIEQRVNYIYFNSQTDRLLNIFSEKIKICFRYSFLGRITETKQINSLVLDNSLVVQYLTNFYKKWKDKITNYLKTSLTISWAKDTKEELYFLPVRMIGIIVVIAIVVNVFLSLALQKQIGLWGWLMRGLFLFVGISGLFCTADWLAIEKSSIFLRKIRRNEKD